MPKSRRMTLVDGLIITAMLTLTAVPWDKLLSHSVSLKDAHKYASLLHPLGTDHLGRDLLARLSQAVSEAVMPLWATVVAATVVGIALGSLTVIPVSGFIWTSIRRAFDLAATLLASIPVTVTTFLLAACLEQAGTTSVIIAVGTVVCFRSYSQVRDLIRQSSLLAYWTAHEAMGGTRLTRVWHYGIFTAWRHDLLAALGLHLSGAVTIEATLSYLGFGVQEPSPSFGNILAAHFAESLKGQWWVMSITLGALMLTAATPRAVLRCLRLLRVFHGAGHVTSATEGLKVSAQPMPELSNPR